MGDVVSGRGEIVALTKTFAKISSSDLKSLVFFIPSSLEDQDPRETYVDLSRIFQIGDRLQFKARPQTLNGGCGYRALDRSVRRFSKDSKDQKPKSAVPMESKELSGFAKIVYLESGFGYCYTVPTGTTKVSLAKVQETGSKVYFTALNAELKFNESLLNYFREGEIIQFVAAQQTEQRNCKWHATQVTKLNQSTVAAASKMPKISAIGAVPSKSVIGTVESSQSSKQNSKRSKQDSQSSKQYSQSSKHYSQSSKQDSLRSKQDSQSSTISLVNDEVQSSPASFAPDWNQIVSPVANIPPDNSEPSWLHGVEKFAPANIESSILTSVVTEYDQKSENQIFAPAVNSRCEINKLQSLEIERKANPLSGFSSFSASNNLLSDFWLQPTLTFADEMIYHEIGFEIMSLIGQLK